MGSKSAKTVHELEKDRKKKIHEQEEILDTLGQDSDKKAVRPVQEYTRKKREEEQEKTDLELEKLTKKRRGAKIAKYIEHLLTFTHDEILKIGIPVTYEWGVWYDGKGVRVSVRDKFKKLHQKAFFLTFNPDYDLFACQKTIWWVEDVYDGVEGELETDVWTPSKN
jgi:hypothetical protein